MASSFKIHEDESALRGAAHETKTGGRQVLGDIQNNFSRTHFPLKREQVSDSVSTGFIENIKALGLKDKQSLSKSEQRSPLKEVKNSLKEKDIKLEVSTHAEHSPNTLNQSDKENIVEKTVLCKKERHQSLDETPLFDEERETAKGASCDESPQISRLELTNTIIDQVYTQFCYKEDIYNYLKTMEQAFQPSAYYMRRQPEITYSMRTILVDWLVEVGEEYNLSNDTLFIAISIIDRFLSLMAITKAKLQLLGTSAMLVASKYEEVYPPEVGAFVYITDDSYTPNQVIRMERLILKVLNFDVSNPNTYTFLMHILAYEKINTKILYLAMYLCELTLLHAEPYLQYYPSIIACSSIALARHCLDYVDIWPSNFVRLTGYSLQQLTPVISNLNDTHEKSFTLNHPAIRQKYSSSKYRCVSQIPFKKLILRDS